MSGSNKTILLVDDDADLVLALTKLLEKNGYRILSAPNIALGYETAKKEKPDAIIIDVIMDKYTDGFTLVNNLITDPATASIPRIVLSSLGLQDALDMIYPEELGIKRILRKPVQPADLLEAVRSLTEGD
jgi:twitching motility two-component system response regulator PilH